MGVTKPHVPGYCFHRRSGQGVCRINGRDYYFGPYDEPQSQVKYHRLIERYLASGKSRLFGVAKESLSMAAVTVAFLKHAETYYGSDSSEYRFFRLIAKPISDHFADMPATEFGPVEAKTFRGLFLAKDASRQYANKVFKKLRQILKWAAGEGIFPTANFEAIRCISPLKAGRTGARESKPVVPVPDEVVDATLPHCSPVLRAMIEFERLTGCRPGEVCAIKPGMVDRSTDVWEIHLDKHKTAHHGKKRTIYVGKAAQAVLLPFLLRGEDEHCFSPADSIRQAGRDRRTTPMNQGNRSGYKGNHKPLTKRKVNHSFSSGTYARAVLNACKKAFPLPKNLPEKARKEWIRNHKWSPNQLRHSFATRVRKEFGLEAAQVLLGHSELGVTQVYAEADKQKAIEAIRRMA